MCEINKLTETETETEICNTNSVVNNDLQFNVCHVLLEVEPDVIMGSIVLVMLMWVAELTKCFVSISALAIKCPVEFQNALQTISLLISYVTECILLCNCHP